MSEQRVALVTGAGSGIGRATARRFGADGCAVVVADIDTAAAMQTVWQITDAGGRAVPVACDVTDDAACARAVQRAVDKFDRLDVLVGNAGIQQGGRLEETTTADWQRVLAVNLVGVANSARAALAVMKAGSALVLVSSVNGLRGSADMAAYDASKAGVLALTRTLAVAHGRAGIRVNAVCPGNTLTEPHLCAAAERGQTMADLQAVLSDYGALGRGAEPAEIAAAIAFLAGPDASFVTGHTLVVDGGATVTL